MKITLEELQAFISVVDSGSITAAAGQRNQTTSGISRALSRLEQKLETTLLRRTTRRLELTGEGELFLAHARQIIDAVDDAEEQIALRRLKPAGRLRINAAVPFMQHVIVPMIGGFRACYPQIDLELNTDDLNIDLLEQRTDIAIRLGVLRDSTIHARRLGASRLRILASPEYIQRHGAPKTIEELSEHSLLGFTQPESLNQWALPYLPGGGSSIMPTVAASSGETLRHLALRGEGIVELSDFMTREDQLVGRLVEVLVEQTLESWQPINAVYYRNTPLVARITCFLDYLTEQIRIQGRHWIKA
ncbi:LysR family transcriptional regulator [Yersinia ruckeri]|uniref:LysR family transcriptional regulator n=1 Tax=Yersinia ruckeri TaxID=29486 RepID=UPI0020C16D69|nr:LysR family transcriptional regulator [Yersinia ruckeri]MCW6540617.1 LysR family transcriptional regulator [Yersinia ruckeri]MCW6637539.1 LysR family transcriptional regulator [Yersinia ruckeri]UZX65719.1 LysR family transcriptional regulator [Yersinia ruckeri]UZY11953.1 LysR family transcriptional regulator [Yersinia ruckeri]